MSGEYSFWEERFIKDGRVWGDAPSPTAVEALGIFKDRGARSILVPGCAYGRHCMAFAVNGLTVTGFDVAMSALKMARGWHSEENAPVFLAKADARKIPFVRGTFKGAYLFNFIHFFLREERFIVLSELGRVLAPGAPLVLSVFSTGDQEYGKGTEVEPDTFEARRGRPAHFFSREDLLEHLKDFRIDRCKEVEEREDHGGRPHVHILWSVWASTSDFANKESSKI